MQKSFMKICMILFAIAVGASACRAPEIESTVIAMNQQKYDDALASAKLAVEKYPENAEAWFYLGQIHANHTKDYAEMNTAFDKVMSLNPKQKVSYSGGNADADQVISSIRDEKFVESFNRALEFIKAAQGTDDAATKKSNYEKALPQLKTAAAVAPNRTEPYQPLAITYVSLGDTMKAKEQVQKMVDGNPSDERTMYVAGEIYSIIGETDAAKSALEKVLVINPSNSDAYQKLGLIASSSGDWDSANTYYLKAMDADPDNADLAYNLGVSYYNQKKFDQAIPFFKKSLDAEPDNDQTYTILASCYAISETNMEDGIAFLEMATNKYPDNATFYEYLAILYGKQGMNEKSNAAFKKSQELKGN